MRACLSVNNIYIYYNVGVLALAVAVVINFNLQNGTRGLHSHPPMAAARGGGRIACMCHACCDSYSYSSLLYASYSHCRALRNPTIKK